MLCRLNFARNNLTGLLSGPIGLVKGKSMNLMLFLLELGMYSTLKGVLMCSIHDPWAMTRRWAFMLKDAENAWRFARFIHGSYFREERFGKEAPLKATVMD